MLETAEIRWFIKGVIPEEILAWFNDYDDFPNSTQTRTDHYLRLPGAGIGIKIREGLIEHKQLGGGDWESGREGDGESGREGDGEKWSIGDCSGSIGRWQKWSFPLDDNAAIAEMLISHPESWQGVTKERSMRILAIDENDNIQCTSYDKVIGTAAGWELTKLKIEGSDEAWWTMGFEAFGTIEKLLETLIKVCNITLENCPLVLTEENCYSYPAWLKNNSEF